MEERDGGVEQMACQHGGQGHAEERAYLLNIVKQIKKAGCNVLLIQKSILRDA